MPAGGTDVPAGPKPPPPPPRSPTPRGAKNKANEKIQAQSPSKPIPKEATEDEGDRRAKDEAIEAIQAQSPSKPIPKEATEDEVKAHDGGAAAAESKNPDAAHVSSTVEGHLKALSKSIEQDQAKFDQSKKKPPSAYHLPDYRVAPCGSGDFGAQILDSLASQVEWIQCMSKLIIPPGSPYFNVDTPARMFYDPYCEWSPTYTKRIGINWCVFLHPEVPVNPTVRFMPMFNTSAPGDGKCQINSWKSQLEGRYESIDPATMDVTSPHAADRTNAIRQQLIDWIEQTRDKPETKAEVEQLCGPLDALVAWVKEEGGHHDAIATLVAYAESRATHVLRHVPASFILAPALWYASISLGEADRLGGVVATIQSHPLTSSRFHLLTDEGQKSMAAVQYRRKLDSPVSHFDPLFQARSYYHALNHPLYEADPSVLYPAIYYPNPRIFLTPILSQRVHTHATGYSPAQSRHIRCFDIVERLNEVLSDESKQQRTKYLVITPFVFLATGDVYLESIAASPTAAQTEMVKQMNDAGCVHFPLQLVVLLELTSEAPTLAGVRERLAQLDEAATNDITKADRPAEKRYNLIIESFMNLSTMDRFYAFPDQAGATITAKALTFCRTNEVSKVETLVDGALVEVGLSRRLIRVDE